MEIKLRSFQIAYRQMFVAVAF